MLKEQGCNKERLFSFLIARDVFIFATKLTTHLLWSLVRIYCAKVAWVCTLPLKRLAIGTRYSYQVRVLLHELYPEQGAVVGSAAFHRSDLVNIDECVLALQKVDCDGVGDWQIDDINFLFQTNHLPISVFRGNPQSTSPEGPSEDCQPSCSSSASTCNEPVSPESDLQTQLIVSVKPECDDLLLSPRPASVIVDIIGTDSNTNDSPSASSLFMCIKSEPNSDGGFEFCSRSSEGNMTSNNDEISDPLLRSPFCRNGPSCNLVQRTRHLASTCSSSSSCCEDPLGTCARRLASPPKTVHHPTSRISAVIQPSRVAVMPHLSSDNSSVRSSVLKSLSNFHRSSPTSRVPTDTAAAPLPAEPFVWPRYDKPSFVYKDENSEVDSDLINPPAVPSDVAAVASPLSSSSFSSGSSIDDGHSSDSELYRHRHLSSSRLLRQITWEDDEEGEPEHCLDSQKLERGFTTADSITSNDGLMTGSLSASLLERNGSIAADRRIRDVRILEKLAVPFSYEEVAYSSNEHFREIKATPGLTIGQISAMLDARRRATNRQAAERCRRVKSAARDGLASQLDRLRLEHVDLSRRILRTRKRRQNKRDELTMAQQQLLRYLVDSEGNPLDPTRWRLQTTAEGELIVVKLEPSKSNPWGISNNSETV